MTFSADRVDALFSKWDRPDSPGCILALIKNGELIHHRGYGMADLERNVPITTDSIFDIGSTGKQFTATVIAILSNKRFLNLDDPIRKYLPMMRPYADQITLRHLIHHTSGIRDYLTLMDLRAMPFENYYSEGELFDLIMHQGRLNFKPGRTYLYSNSGYFLLGIIAQRVTGKHITELIQEHILDPLGMKYTTFNKDYRPIVKNRAVSYERSDDKGTFVNALALSGGFGDGAILTNVNDLLLWDRNFYGNKLNNSQPDLIDQLHSKGKLNNGKSIPYAFGLVLDTFNGLRVVKHAGGWAGYRTELMRFPDQKFSVICISNLGDIEPSFLCQQVAGIFLEDEMKITVKKSKPQSIYNGPTGVFQGKHFTAEITVKDNIPYFFIGDGEYPLKPVGRREYQVGRLPYTVSFGSKGNDAIQFNDYGEATTRLKHVRTTRFSPPSFDIYAGVYVSRELDIRYTIESQNNELQLKRTSFDKPHSLHPLTENTFSSTIGELRIQYENEAVKGFTMLAGRVTNIAFRKIK